MLTMKNIEEKKKRKWDGSKVDRLCISQNRALGHKMLMEDYFAEVCTYPAHHFHRRNNRLIARINGWKEKMRSMGAK
jgi:hypothetical protein